MNAFLIALILGQDNKILQYRLGRLVDEDSRKLEIVDVTEYKLIYAIRNKKIHVNGLRIKDNKIVGHNINIDRYAKIYNTSIKGLFPIVIIKQLESNNTTIGYVISDYNGNLLRLRTEDIITYGKNYGIANAKIVKRNGQEYISSITGLFESKTINKNVQKDRDNIDTKTDTKDEFKYPTVSEFKAKMDKAGYKYSIINDDTQLQYIDNRVVIALIPEGIKSIGGIAQNSSTDPECLSSKVQVIYLPSTFENCISLYAFSWLNQLKEIVLHDDIKVVDYSDIIPYIIKDIKVNIPINAVSIRSIFVNRDQGVQMITDFSPYKSLRNMHNSFCDVDIPEDINFGAIQNMTGSFRNINNPNLTIRFNENIEVLGGFDSIKIKELDFSSAVNLSTINYGSFSNIEGIKKIDLSNCVNLKRLPTQSFNHLEDLEEIILPPNLENIGDYCLSECPKLKSIKLPKSLQCIGKDAFCDTAITELGLGENLRQADINCKDMSVRLLHPNTLFTAILQRTCVNDIFVEDTLQVFNKMSFYLTAFNSIQIPSNLREVGDSAFFNSKVTGNDKGLDLSHCSKLKRIGDQAFELSDFRYILLPDGVETIGRRCFRMMGYINWVYIPASVTKIGQLTFQGAGLSNPLGLIVYCQKGSYIDKYCKKNSINTRYVNSASDVINIEQVADIDSKKLSKLRMLLSSDPNLSILLKDNYINRAVELYNLNSDLTTERELPNIELDRSNTVNVSVTEILKTDEIAELNRCKTTTTTIVEEFSIISYMNMITSIAPNFNKFLKKQYFEYMRNNNMIAFKEIKFTCGQYSVITIKLNISDIDVEIMLLQAGQSIIYCTVYNLKSIVSTPMALFITHPRKSIAKSMRDKTAYPLTSHGSNCNIPFYIKQKLTNILVQQLELIGCGAIKRSKENNIMAVDYIYLYSFLDREIIRAHAVVFMQEKALCFDSLSNIEILDRCSIDSLPDKWRKDIIQSAFSQNQLDAVIPKIVLGDDYLKRMLKADNAYDKLEPCIEWEISKALNDAGISRPHKLASSIFTTGKDKIFNCDIPKTVFDMILETPYFYKTKKSSKDIQDVCRMIGGYYLDKGRYILKSFIITNALKIKKYNSKIVERQPTQLLFIQDTLEADEDEKICYISSLSLNDILYQIFNMYSNDTSTYDVKLDNNIAVLRDYQVVESKRGYTKGRIMIPSYIAVHKATGAIFLLSQYTSNSIKMVYKIFRFRNIKEALEFSSWVDTSDILDDNKKVVSNAYQLIYNIMAEIVGNNNNKIANQFKYIRDLVIDGYPNGYALTGYINSYYKLLAKQPKDQ